METLGHGAFTFALTQGLGGAAIEGEDIELSGLMRYVSREVQRLTTTGQGLQSLRGREMRDAGSMRQCARIVCAMVAIDQMDSTCTNPVDDQSSTRYQG